MAVGCSQGTEPAQNDELHSYMDSIHSVHAFDDKVDYNVGAFSYTVNYQYQDVFELCPVFYYVDNGVLYTTEKFAGLQLTYSNEADSTIAYVRLIDFDQQQNHNSSGWYSLDVKNANLRKRPHTYLSSISLRCYVGDRIDLYGPNHPSNPMCVLYTSTKLIDFGQGINVMNQNIENLMTYLK